ncbi:DNA methyltransferase [Candidatus Harpocratesius sp.]
MQLVAGKYGFCEIVNCIYAMRKMKDKSVDLIWTDPPWGYTYDGTNPKGINQQTKHPERINYNDEFNPDFNKKWFSEAIRIANGVVICPGRIHLNWWIKLTEPIGILTLIFKNGQNSTRISKYAGSAYYLCYGDFFKTHKFHRDFYQTYIQNGFLRKNRELIHPSPKDFETWKELIEELSPQSIMDPFFGSGTCGEVAETLGIRWYGCEIEPRYLEDIQKRIQAGINRRKKREKYHYYLESKNYTQKVLEL